MSALRTTYGIHANAITGGISSAADWGGLVRDLDAGGLVTTAARDALADVVSQGRFAVAGFSAAASLRDVLACVAADVTADTVSRSTADVEHDVAALRRFAAYVETRFPSDSPQRGGLRRGLDDVAEEYRAALVGLLQLAASQIARTDATLRAPLLRPAPAASNASLHSDPFAFQRQHARAIQRRAAAVHAQGKAVVVDHRLFPRCPPRAVLGDATAAGGAVIGPAGDFDPKRATGPDVWLCHRSNRSASDSAAAGIPHELEALRLPLLGALDPAGTAASTFSALDGALSCADATGAAGLGLALLGAAAPGVILPIPAPSALLHQPRAHASSLAGVLAEQDVLGQLVLSQYFPDPAGVHDVIGGSTITTVDERCSILAGASALLGPTAILLREHIPGATPLAQLRAVCGPLAEGRPLFRFVATELLRALADAAGQCCYDVARVGHAEAGAARGAAAVTLEHVYLSECGTRLTMRGVPWTEPLEEVAVPAFGITGGAAALRDRSRALLQAYACMLRELLGLAPVPPQAALRTVTRAAAEAGLVLFVGEAVAIELAPNPRELSAVGGGRSGTLRWLPATVAVQAPRGHSKPPTSAAPASAIIDVVDDPADASTLLSQHGSGLQTPPVSRSGGPEGGRLPTTRLVVQAVAPGSASLCCRLEMTQPSATSAPPAASQPVAAVLVPVTVHPSGVSPTLAAVLDAVAPLPANAPAAEALRLLEVAVGDGASSPMAAVLRAFGTFAAALSVRDAHSAADAAQQAAVSPPRSDGGTAGAGAVTMLLHDCVATVAGTMQRPPALPGSSGDGDAWDGPTEEVTLEELVASHPYFATSADERGEGEMLRHVADDYAQWTFPLLHAS